MKNVVPEPDARNIAMGLEELRKEIDCVDAQLLTLLLKRMALAQQIGRIKQQQQRQVMDIARENQVMRRLRELNRGRLPEQALERIFCEIMATARNLQQTDNRKN